MRTHLVAIAGLAFLVLKPGWEVRGQGQVFLHAERVIPFTTPVSADTFRLIAIGRDTLKASLTFSIHSSSGRTIFIEKFSALDLIGFGLNESDQHRATKAEERQFIANRVSHFFDDDRFSSPAIKPTEPAREFVDLSVWRELRKDSTAIGFHFLLGEENNRWIAYSKHQGKTVVYRHSD